MHNPVRFTLRFLAIAAVIIVASLAILTYSSRPGPSASALVGTDDPTPLTCDNTACNTWCWSAGTHANVGTFAKKTIHQPDACAPGTGGCVTYTCP